GTAAPAAGLIRATRRRGQGHRPMFPMHEINADGVAPVNVTVKSAGRVVLVKHMVQPVPLDQTVRVVEPVGRGQKVIDRPVSIVGRGWWGSLHRLTSVQAEYAIYNWNRPLVKIKTRQIDKESQSL